MGALACALLTAAGLAAAMPPSTLLHSPAATCDVTPEEECFGIRPGALMQAEEWTACTASFIFANATDLFIGTAAHCVNGEGNRVWFYNVNQTTPGLDLTRPPDGEAVFVPDEWDQANYDNAMGKWDFALVRIDAARHSDVFPKMRHWDGPHGLHNTTGSSTDRAYFYGHGIGLGGAAPARVGIGPTWDGGPTFHVKATTTNRDSGGPWIDAQGRAIGHETAGESVFGLTEGTDEGVHVRWLLEVTAERGLHLVLVDAGQDPIEVMRSLRVTPPSNDLSTGDSADANDLPAPGVGIFLLALLAVARLGRAK